MDGMQILKFEIEGMGKQFRIAIAQNAEELQAAANEAIKKLATEEVLTAKVTQMAEKELDDQIRKAIEGYFRYGQGKQIIDSAVSGFFGIKEQDR